jgi:hypothetical protein
MTDNNNYTSTPDSIDGKLQDPTKLALMTRTLGFLLPNSQKKKSFHSIDVQEKPMQRQTSLPAPNA